ncbi:MAG: hypothetical protein LLG05_02105, partial [Porphyromonadaceae bacterium]|nr:hypothetical protein [Porphyromonadaceae bacterium]
ELTRELKLLKEIHFAPSVKRRKREMNFIVTKVGGTVLVDIVKNVHQTQIKAEKDKWETGCCYSMN